MGLLDVPETLDKLVTEWRSKLLLENWKINTRMSLTVNGNENVYASCQVHSNYNQIWLTFRPDFKGDEDEWQRIVIHELLHAAMGRIDQFVETVLMNQLPDGEKKLASAAYVNLIEAYTEQMARAIWTMTREKKVEIDTTMKGDISYEQI